MMMATAVAGTVITAPHAVAKPRPHTTPHISCIDGHIVTNLADCPAIPRHNAGGDAPIGGGNPRRGLLGLGIGPL